MLDEGDVDPRQGELSVTRLDGPAKTRLDKPVPWAGADAMQDDGTPVQLLTNLPAALADRYIIERPLIAVSGEADLAVVRPRAGELRRFVAKIYRYGTRPKSGVLELVSKSNPEHVIQLHEHGQSSGRAYELLEYAEHGSLDDLHPPGRPLAADRVLEVLEELAAALHHLHQQGVIHRDLKPANVLVRTLDPLDLVLTDFGIASASNATVHYTSAHRTIRYAAPETIAGEVSAASDYWSLGIMLVELLTGRHPLHGMSEVVMQAQLLKSDLAIPSLEAPWGLLCGGLLQRDPATRWQHAEIGRWLARDSTLTLPASQSVTGHRAYTFNRSTYATPSALADAFALHVGEAEKHLQRGYVTKWLSDEVRDYELASNVQDLTEQHAHDRDLMLMTVTARLGAERPPTFRGVELTRDSLVSTARSVVSARGGGQMATLEAMFEHGVLGLYAEVAQNTDLASVASSWESRHAALADAHAHLSEALRIGGAPALRADALAVVLLTILDPAMTERIQASAQRMVDDANHRMGFAPSIVRRYRSTSADQTAVDIAVVSLGAHIEATAAWKAASTELLARAGVIDVTDIRALLDAGASVEGPTPARRTPLMAAAEANPNPHVVEALVAAGARLEARAEDGSAPLLLAIMSNPAADVVDALIRGGASLESRDAKGRTALELAAIVRNDSRVVELLLDAGATVTPEAWAAAGRNANPSVLAALRHRYPAPAPSGTTQPASSTPTPSEEQEIMGGCLAVAIVLIVIGGAISVITEFPWVGVVGGAALAWLVYQRWVRPHV